MNQDVDGERLHRAVNELRSALVADDLPFAVTGVDAARREHTALGA